MIFSSSLELDKSNADITYLNLASVLSEQGQHEESEALCRKAVFCCQERLISSALLSPGVCRK